MTLTLPKEDWRVLLATIGEHGLDVLSPGRGKYLSSHGCYPTEGRCYQLLEELRRQYAEATGEPPPDSLLRRKHVRKAGEACLPEALR